MVLELCKGVRCVDLGESFQTHIFLQNLASMQPRTSPVKFAASRLRCEANCAVEGEANRSHVCMQLCASKCTAQNEFVQQSSNDGTDLFMVVFCKHFEETYLATPTNVFLFFASEYTKFSISLQLHII